MVRGLLKAELVSCDFYSWGLLESDELDMSWWSDILAHCLFIGGFLASMCLIVPLPMPHGRFLPLRSSRPTTPIFSRCSDVSCQKLHIIPREATYPI